MLFQVLIGSFISRGQCYQKKVDILNDCLKNVFHNFIPNRITKCKYKDQPWITAVMKSKLKEQSNLTKTYYKYGKRKS